MPLPGFPDVGVTEGRKLEGIRVYGQVLWTMPLLHADVSPDAVPLCPTIAQMCPTVAPNAVGWGEQAVLPHSLCCWS